MKKHVLAKIKAILILVPMVLLASCGWLTEEEGDDRIDVKGQRVVYVGSTVRPLYSIYAPSYADFDYATIDIRSNNPSIGEAYFTESCDEDDEGWTEFVVEGKKKGTFKVTLSVEEFELATTFEVTVVDKDSLCFVNPPKILEKDNTVKLDVQNEQGLSLNYRSSNEEVAEVDANGNVLAKKAGVSTITVYTSDGVLSSSCLITVKTGLAADKFYWGEWISMYDGSSLVIKEKDVSWYDCYDSTKEEPVELEVDASDSNKITIVAGPKVSVENLIEEGGTAVFTKSSENVIIFDKYDLNDNEEGLNIPYFRKGGTDLKYTLQLIGFTKEAQSTSRAVSSQKMSGLKVTGKSNTYTSYGTDPNDPNEAVSDDEGKVELKAPVAGDVQTITVENTDGSLIVIPDIKIDTDGSNIGKVPVVNKGDYSLKISGTVDEDQLYQDDGYLYEGTEYEMTVVITNISEVSSGAGTIKIEAADDKLSVKSSDGKSLDSILVPTLRPGATKELKVKITASGLDTPYIDSGLKVTVRNAKSSVSPAREWEDFVPVRVFKEKIPIAFYPLSINAASGEGSTDAVLHFFVIYPDGDGSYQELKDMQSGLMEVPNFGSDKPYIIALCGATAKSAQDSTEMVYSVHINSEDEIDFDSNEDWDNILDFGEGNDSEKTACSIPGDSFKAGLVAGDIDFWKVYLK